MALINKLNDLGDAVRTATNTTQEYTLEQMAEIIANDLIDPSGLPACEEVEW